MIISSATIITVLFVGGFHIDNSTVLISLIIKGSTTYRLGCSFMEKRLFGNYYYCIIEPLFGLALVWLIVGSIKPLRVVHDQPIRWMVIALVLSILLHLFLWLYFIL